MAIHQISQANLNYISKQRQSQKPKSIKEAKMPLAPVKADELVLSKNSKEAKKFNIDRNTKFKIGCYSLLAAGIALQFVADYKRNHLAKHIDFQPAKTLEEAKNFACKHLKIKKYALTDLDCANYVNEALSAFNNSSKTHEKLISEVTSVDKMETNTGIPLFSFIPNNEQRGNLRVSEKNILQLIKESFQNISTAKDSFLKGEGIDKDIKAIYQKFLNDPSSLSFKEKMNFMVFCDSHNENILFDKTVAIFAQYLSDETCIKYLKANNLASTIEDFSKLSIEDRTAIIARLSKDTDHEYRIYSTGEFGAINHEIGHLMHYRNIGESYGYMTQEKKFNFSETLLRARTDDFSSAVFDNISWYSLTSNNEYVAEVYSYLKAGHKLCPEIMKRYFTLGGVLP